MKNNKNIKLLIVDDSLTIRKHVSKILNQENDIEIIGEAKDGKEAVKKNIQLTPDVILMDIIMPVMDGLDAVKQIMNSNPIPIIIHSASNENGIKSKIWDAITAGALDTINKQDAETNPIKWENNLKRTIRAASRIKVKKQSNNKKINNIIPKNKPKEKYNLIAFGISTGGPAIISKILKFFPKNFDLPIILVIHMNSTGTDSFPEWLGEKSSIKVKFAQNHMNVFEQNGVCLVAPHNYHIKLNNNILKIFKSEPVNYCMPSIDVFFNSLAQNSIIKPIAVLLSGMGYDGAKGLKEIKENGGYTICQDESTSAVFGMPKAAIDINAANIVLPDYNIPNKIFSLLDMKNI